MSFKRVVVVGAGVIGLTSAYRILTEVPDVEVTIVADQFTPDTTGDGAAGLFEPYIAGDTPPERMLKWVEDTWNYFNSIAKSENSASEGIFPISGYSLYAVAPAEKPFWSGVVKNFRVLAEDELEEFSCLNAKYACFFTTFICECRKHLPILQQRFVSSGGKFEMRKLSSLSEVANDYDIIVNCSGVRAAQLVGDTSVYPVRGHVLRARTSVVKMFYVLDNCNQSGETTYIIPNSDLVVLGGTCQKGDWRLTSDAAESQGVLERCSQLFPHLRHAEIVTSWTGLRPGRSQVRLELENAVLNGKNVQVVHNYGHGGSGVTLCWGCAAEAVDIVKQAIAAKP